MYYVAVEPVAGPHERRLTRLALDQLLKLRFGDGVMQHWCIFISVCILTSAHILPLVIALQMIHSVAVESVAGAHERCLSRLGLDQLLELRFGDGVRQHW